MNPHNISGELYREVVWVGKDFTLRIERPHNLYIGSTTHRVVDALGRVYCYPSPTTGLTYIKWEHCNKNNPVDF